MLQSSEHQNDQTQKQFLHSSRHTTLLYNYLFTTHTFFILCVYIYIRFFTEYKKFHADAEFFCLLTVLSLWTNKNALMQINGVQSFSLFCYFYCFLCITILCSKLLRYESICKEHEFDIQKHLPSRSVRNSNESCLCDSNWKSISSLSRGVSKTRCCRN